MNFNEEFDKHISQPRALPYFTNTVCCYSVVGTRIKRVFNFDGIEEIPLIYNTEPLLECILEMVYGFAPEHVKVYLITDDSLLVVRQDGRVEIVVRIDIVNVEFIYTEENLKYIDEL